MASGKRRAMNCGLAHTKPCWVFVPLGCLWKSAATSMMNPSRYMPRAFIAEALVHVYIEEDFRLFLVVKGTSMRLRYLRLWSGSSAQPRLRAFCWEDDVPHFRENASGTPKEWNLPSNAPKSAAEHALFGAKAPARA